jgi:hypothetical protein
MGRNPFTCSQVRTASGMMGPLPLTTSNSMLCDREATARQRGQGAALGGPKVKHAPQRREGRQDV